MGSKLSITMRGENEKDGPKYEPVITKLEIPTKFRWRAKMGAEFLFTNDKVIELVVTDSGTFMIHKEVFSGMLLPFFWGQLNKGAKPMMESMNLALQEYSERYR